MLEVRGLSKHFGGVHANKDVNLQLNMHQIHALIGPNGAGKSTFIGQISGELQPDQGNVVFDGTDISHLTAEQRSRLGLGRLFQTTALFNELSVLDNVRIPLLHSKNQSNVVKRWFWEPVKADQKTRAIAMQMLQRVGMEKHPDQRVDTLSHGEQRQLEMVVTLATSPRCLLLDEPMAGMSSEESIRMLKLIRTLKADHAILLVEHDMRAVFDLADIISVLVDGQIIASGSVDEIRRNPAVQQAYLGTNQC